MNSGECYTPDEIDDILLREFGLPADKTAVEESLFGALPQTMTDEEAKAGRLDED